MRICRGLGSEGPTGSAAGRSGTPAGKSRRIEWRHRRPETSMAMYAHDRVEIGNPILGEKNHIYETSEKGRSKKNLHS